jgi:translocation and assembly module TamA
VIQDAETVRNLAYTRRGVPVTETLLLDFQERLRKSGLFDTVAVTLDADPAQADAASVLVRVSETPLQSYTFGVGVSANTGPRMTVEHTHRRVFGWPAVAHNKLEWGRDSQSWSGDFSTHPSEGFYRNLLGVQIERVTSNTDVVLSQRLRLGRTQDTPRIERLYFMELLRSRQADLPGTTGSVRSHSGATSGRFQAAAMRAQSIRRSALPTMVAMASTSGTTNSSSSSSVMAVTASQRRPPVAACTRSISGQVATTTIVAQMAGPRKGRNTHSDTPNSSPMNSTPKVTRARSRPGGSGASGGFTAGVPRSG